jgi:hypothetical protein
LHDNGLKLLRERGAHSVRLSLSHTRDYAAAVAILGDPAGLDQVPELSSLVSSARRPLNAGRSSERARASTRGVEPL